MTFNQLRGTLYQLIDGRLYRDVECMFPARCAGIEHFMFKVAKHLDRNIEFVVNTRDYPQSGKYFGKAQPILSFSKVVTRIFNQHNFSSVQKFAQA